MDPHSGAVPIPSGSHHHHYLADDNNRSDPTGAGLFAMAAALPLGSSPIVGTPMSYLFRDRERTQGQPLPGTRPQHPSAPQARSLTQDAGMAGSWKSSVDNSSWLDAYQARRMEATAVQPVQVGVAFIGRQQSMGGEQQPTDSSPHMSFTSNAGGQLCNTSAQEESKGPQMAMARTLNGRHSLDGPKSSLPLPAQFSSTQEAQADSTTDTDLRQPLLASPQYAAPPAGATAAQGTTGTGAAAQEGAVLKAFVFGMINATVGLPSLIAFAAIVFKAPVYGPYLGTLCKLFFFSSAIHQLVFVAMSSLPFAIGQVQDVGLIFLSAMATSIAIDCEETGRDASTALGTSLLTMTLATTVVGALTVLVGKYKLAQLVQYVPLPVVGGYLGYVGYFCIAGGVALGCSAQIDTLLSWSHLFHMDAAIKLIPTLATCLVLMFTLEHFTHPLALPGMLLAIPMAFHVVLWSCGLTLADAQAAGWVLEPTEGSQEFWHLWELFNLQEGVKGIYWQSMLAQGPKLVGLFLVVAFGSSMDVAAIQQDMPQPLDFNRELITVGVSNCVVGLLGAGYTGSYIFSQTVFTMRAGVTSRLNGVVLAVAELVVFALPFSVVQYCPNFFFGALLLWFGVEICRDWLIYSCKKLSVQEYLLLWMTFGFVMAFDLELGIALGVVASTIYFAFKYAQSQLTAVRVLPASSGAMHSYEVGRLLDLLSQHVSTCTLSGFIFFGSSSSIADAIHKIADQMVQEAGDRYADACQELAATAPSLDQKSDHRDNKVVVSMSDVPMFIILDMRHVSHVDATGARTLSSLVSSLACKGIQVIYAGISPRATSLRRLLEAHGVALMSADPAPWMPAAASTQLPCSPRAPDSARLKSVPDTARCHDAGATRVDVNITPPEGVCYEFPSVEAAMLFVEGSYIRLAVARGVLSRPAQRISLLELLQHHAAKEKSVSGEDMQEAVQQLQGCLQEVHLQQGAVLLQAGQSVDRLILVLEGVLQLEVPHHTQPDHAASAQDSDASLINQSEVGRSRSCYYSPGCWVLSTEFFLDRPAPGVVTCASGPAMLLVLSQASYLKLMTDAPKAISILQWALLRVSSMELVEARDRNERVTA